MTGGRIFIVLLSLILSGCGLTSVQKQQVVQFATATETVSITAQDQFKSIRDKVIELERRRLIMRNQSPPRTLDLDQGLNASGVATLIGTLKALQSYGDILNKLASNDQSEAIAKAATDFMTQFEAAKKAQNSSYALDEQKKKAILGVIDIGGSWLVESEKKKHIKNIVQAYSKEVGQLAELLKVDLSLKSDSLCIEASQRKQSNGRVGMIDIYCTSSDALMEISSDTLKEKGHSFVEREFAYNSLVLAQQAQDEMKVLSSESDKAVSKLVTANEQLRQVIESDQHSSEDIRAFARQVDELETHINVLKGK